MENILGILDSCREWVLWGFVVISIKNYASGAGSKERTEFMICTKRRVDECRTVDKESISLLQVRKRDKSN
jgi:hypothetical protein